MCVAPLQDPLQELAWSSSLLHYLCMGMSKLPFAPVKGLAVRLKTSATSAPVH